MSDLAPRLEQPKEIAAKKIRDAVEFFLYYRIVAHFFVEAQRDDPDAEDEVAERIIESIENAILYMGRKNV